MQRFLSFAVAALFMISASSAQAAIDAAGADALKRDVTEAISFQTDIAKTTGQGLALGGEITVTPKGSYYEVQLPDVAYILAGGGKFAIGTIVANAVPSETAGEYILSVKLPSPFTAFGPDNTAAAEVIFGKQRFSGAWRPALGIFTKIDAEYGDTAIRMLKKEGDTEVSGTLASIKIMLNLTENSDKTWSGPNSLDLGGIKITISGLDNGTLGIGRIASVSSYDRVNLSAANEMKRNMQGIMKNGVKPTPDEQRALVEKLADSMGGFADGMSNKLEMTDLAIDLIPGKDPQHPSKSTQPVRAGLAKLTTQFDMKGMTQEKGSTDIKFSINGLKIDNQPEDTAGLIPSDANLEIAIGSLPMKEITDSFRNMTAQALESAFKAEEAAGTVYQAKAQTEMQQQIMMGMMSIPQLLVNAGSTLAISNTYFNAPDLGTTLDGKFTASPTSPVLATGSLMLVFKGMDELITKLQALSKKPDANPRTAGIAQALIFMQLQGQQGQADGKSTRSYKFDVTPEGQMTLNGVDMSMVMGMMGGMNNAGGGGDGGAQDGMPQKAPDAAPDMTPQDHGMVPAPTP